MNLGRLNRSLLALSLAAALAATGCDTTRPPKISIVDSRIVEQQPEATRVDLTLELTNANPDPVPLVEFKYTADLDGQRVFDSRCSAQATLRRLGTQTLVLPVVIPTEKFSGSLNGSHTLVVSGKLYYIAPGQLGEVLFDTGVRVPKVSFNGTVPVTIGAADGS